MKSQSVNALVEEIHTAFNSEGDRLLKEAEQILSTPQSDDEASRLAALGFTATAKAKNHLNLEAQKEASKETAKLIRHYLTHYPQNRFINQDGVTRLCEKYNLIQGGVDSYVGNVPSDNLKEIERFKLKDKDRAPAREMGWSILASIYLSESRADAAPKFDTKLQICAPQHDFNTQGKEIKNRKLSQIIPDPVVLMPCIGGFLIVTAWGAEAKDEQVQNPNKN